MTEIGNLAGNPELTGNGHAELWGFLPDTNPSSIQQIHKTNATAIGTYALNTNDPDSLTVTSGNGTRRWAFAFLGGDDYVFDKAAQESSTSVYRFRPPRNGTESFTRILTNSGKQMVGAGVSTCAQVVPPIDIRGAGRAARRAGARLGPCPTPTTDRPTRSRPTRRAASPRRSRWWTWLTRSRAPTRRSPA